MKEFVVVKLGRPSADMLHAGGLAVALAYAYQTRVRLIDAGTICRLQLDDVADDAIPDAIDLATLLRLPTEHQLRSFRGRRTRLTRPIANLDGLLALLFTVPGRKKKQPNQPVDTVPGRSRLVSVADLYYYPKESSSDSSNEGANTVSRDKVLNVASLSNAMTKVNGAIERWHKYIERVSDCPKNWLAEALGDYDINSPAIPVTKRKDGDDISVLMTVDPSFGYTTHRPHSDGFIADKKNIAIQGVRYVGLFTAIGASRFLRAQRAGGNLINLYVPQPQSLVIDAKCTLPVMSGAESARIAVLQRWLALLVDNHNAGSHWSGLSYQMLQTQGPSQSISVEHGHLDAAWLTTVTQATGIGFISYWRKVLYTPQVIELKYLIDFLYNRCPITWFEHLHDLTMQWHRTGGKDIRPYFTTEVTEIIKMIGHNGTPFKILFGNKAGTLRIGRALRSLEEINTAYLNELIEALRYVQSLDDLLNVLLLIAQRCAVAKDSGHVKADYVIVPTENDLEALLVQVEQFDVTTLARLIQVLAVLRYPPKNDDNNSDSNEGVPPNQKDDVNGSSTDDNDMNTADEEIENETTGPETSV